MEDQIKQNENEQESVLLNDVIKNIKFSTLKDIMVKPLATDKIKKEVISQVPTGKKDDNGYELYDTKTEIKEVDSDFGRGIVLVLPLDCEIPNIKVGNIVIYNKKFAMNFDLYKNSQLVKPYDIVALEK